MTCASGPLNGVGVLLLHAGHLAWCTMSCTSMPRMPGGCLRELGAHSGLRTSVVVVRVQPNATDALRLRETTHMLVQRPAQSWVGVTAS